jgi:hypothetical protein
MPGESSSDASLSCTFPSFFIQEGFDFRAHTFFVRLLIMAVEQMTFILFVNI